MRWSNSKNLYAAVAKLLVMLGSVLLLYLEKSFCFFGNSKSSVYDERQNCKIERRKRNLKFFSPVSRGERETGNSLLQFREEKEKSKKIFSTFERRKRNGFSILKLWEEKEKVKTISPFSRREREMLNVVLQFWEEKEKFEILFSSFERRKRNLKFLSLVLRRERENKSSYYYRDYK